MRCETWDVEPERDDKTGEVRVTCPLCPAVITTATAAGSPDALCEHMNDVHWRPKRGNA